MPAYLVETMLPLQGSFAIPTDLCTGTASAQVLSASPGAIQGISLALAEIPNRFAYHMK